MRIVQFHEPGQGSRVGVMQGDDVFDVTEIAGDGSLALLMAAQSGSVPDVEGAPRVASYAELDVAPDPARRHLRLRLDPPEVWGAGVTMGVTRFFRGAPYGYTLFVVNCTSQVGDGGL